MKISGSFCLVNYCRNATTVVGNAVAGGAISATGDLVGSSVICVVVGSSVIGGKLMVGYSVTGALVGLGVLLFGNEIVRLSMFGPPLLVLAFTFKLNLLLGMSFPCCPRHMFPNLHQLQASLSFPSGHRQCRWYMGMEKY